MRTEEQKVVQAPITIILGGKQYDIKPLVIRDSREWRKKVSGVLGDVAKYAKTKNPEDVEQALLSIMMDTPDAIIDLVFDYARDLPRETIEAEATDMEIGQAFKLIMEVAFPLAKMAVKAVQ